MPPRVGAERPAKLLADVNNDRTAVLLYALQAKRALRFGCGRKGGECTEKLKKENGRVVFCVGHATVLRWGQFNKEKGTAVSNPKLRGG